MQVNLAEGHFVYNFSNEKTAHQINKLDHMNAYNYIVIFFVSFVGLNISFPSGIILQTSIQHFYSEKLLYQGKMASSFTNEFFSHHTRSNSLPSSSHNLTLRVEEQLCHLRSSELATSSSSYISQNLVSLGELYECIDCLLQLPTQQSISVERSGGFVDQVLDGSLESLDFCGIARDILSEMKQSVQDLQSSLRRRGECDVAKEVSVCMAERKRGNKLIHKCLSDIKKIEKKSCSSSAEISGMDMFSILHEAEMMTSCVLQSLLSFLSDAKTKSKQSSWLKLKFSRSSKTINIQSVRETLEELDMNIQGFEDELERLFKRLIKARVSILNIINL